MQVTRIGDFEVHRITEYEGPFIAPEDFLPDFDPEVLRANPDLTGPRLIDPQTGKLVFSFHSFVVKTGRHTILDPFLPRKRQGTPVPPAIPPAADALSRRSRCCRGRARGGRLCDVHASALGPCRLEYPAQPTAAGSRPSPTRATSSARREFDHWQGVQQRGEETPHRFAFEDSVLPVVPHRAVAAGRR